MITTFSSCLFILGVIDYKDENSEFKLDLSYYFSIFGAIICTAYTYYTHKNIMTFLVSISLLGEEQMTENDNANFSPKSLVAIRNPVTKYLVKCSSTFFKTTAEAFSLTQLLQKIKLRKERNLKNQEQPPQSQSLFVKGKLSPNGKKTLQTLNASLDIKSASMYDFKEHNSALKQETNHTKSPKQQQQICLICINNIANAVLMDCGHGGICMQCAIDLWKKNSECYLCRSKIKSVYEVDDKPKETEEVVQVVAEMKIQQESEQEQEFSEYSNNYEDDFSEENQQEQS